MQSAQGERALGLGFIRVLSLIINSLRDCNFLFPADSWSPNHALEVKAVPKHRAQGIRDSPRILPQIGWYPLKPNRSGL
jgi:hypothetical protein